MKGNSLDGWPDSAIISHARAFAAWHRKNGRGNTADLLEKMAERLNTLGPPPPDDPSRRIEDEEPDAGREKHESHETQHPHPPGQVKVP